MASLTCLALEAGSQQEHEVTGPCVTRLSADSPRLIHKAAMQGSQEQQERQTMMHKHFEPSASILFSHVPLARVSHMVKPRYKG